MSTVSLTLDDECRRLDPVIYDVSSALLAVTGDAVTTTIEGILQRIVEEIDVDRGTLLEPGERGHTIKSAYAWARRPIADEDVDTRASRLRTLFGRFGVDSGVLISGDIGREARAELFPAVQSAVAIATAIGSRCSILALEAFRAPRVWRPPLIGRLRLLGEMLAGALHRLAQERALRKTHVEAARHATRHGDRARAEATPSVAVFDDIVGGSVALRTALTHVQQVADTDSTVLLLGETGTGKELFARAIHSNSLRRGHLLVSVNCAALPASLIESELFGHERGAFTGAVGERKGRFELAHRGTLFLDEIGDLPLEMQAKLLRVLQDRTFERVGSSQSQKVDVRVIAATNRGLDEAVAAGRFRADLYYRLSVFPIRLPPLRERREDIPALVWAIINKRQQAMGRSIKHVPRAVIERLQAYRWPGNVRELENVVERALIHSGGEAILLDDDFSVEMMDLEPADSRLLTVERRHIQQVLQNCHWRINGNGNAAERLGLHPNTLRFRMKKLGIVRIPSPRQSAAPSAPFERRAPAAAVRSL
jgi:transcriptional regulator with GAF, ATPase, and Fis domain